MVAPIENCVNPARALGPSSEKVKRIGAPHQRKLFARTAFRRFEESPGADRCILDIFEAVEGRQMVAAFDGGAIASDAGALLLGTTTRAIRMVKSADMAMLA
jgi:hypothetical protein